MVTRLADLSCRQTSPIATPLPFRTPAGLRILRRCTLVIADPSENHRLAALAAHYDLIAIRPTTERALQHACHNADVALVSLDLTTRLPFHFKRSLVHLATARGVRFELCYAPGVLAADAAARRNLIGNATQLIRAAKGKGLVMSSEARSPAGLRAPIDLVNLAAVWGLSSDKGREAVEREARLVVLTADMKRTSWKGVIDVVDGGQAMPTKPVKSAKPVKPANPVKPVKTVKPVKPIEEEEDESKQVAPSTKRKPEAPMSKRQAKRARKEASASLGSASLGAAIQGAAIQGVVSILGAATMSDKPSDKTSNQPSNQPSNNTNNNHYNNNKLATSNQPS